jgi:hypothetical protein
MRGLVPSLTLDAQPKTAATGPLATGLAALAASDYATAETDLAQVKGAGKADAKLGLAQAAFEQGKYAEADKHAQAARTSAAHKVKAAVRHPRSLCYGAGVNACAILTNRFTFPQEFYRGSTGGAGGAGGCIGAASAPGTGGAGWPAESLIKAGAVVKTLPAVSGKRYVAAGVHDRAVSGRAQPRCRQRPGSMPRSRSFCASRSARFSASSLPRSASFWREPRECRRLARHPQGSGGAA